MRSDRGFVSPQAILFGFVQPAKEEVRNVPRRRRIGFIQPGRRALLAVVEPISRLTRQARRLPADFAVPVAEADPGYRLVFEAVPLGLGRLSLEGDFLEANPALLSLLGYPAERLTRLNVHQLSHEDDVEPNRALLAAAAEGSAPQFSLEIRLLAADGNYLWCELHVSTVREGDGRPLYHVVLIEDISDRKGQELLLTHRAEHDGLTGLHNRAVFFARLDK